jgi:hypothetical protein
VSVWRSAYIHVEYDCHCCLCIHFFNNVWSSPSGHEMTWKLRNSSETALATNHEFITRCFLVDTLTTSRRQLLHTAKLLFPLYAKISRTRHNRKHLEWHNAEFSWLACRKRTQKFHSCFKTI